MSVRAWTAPRRPRRPRLGSRASSAGRVGAPVPTCVLATPFARDYLGRGLVQRRHRLHGGVDPLLLGDAFLDRGRNYACAERLGEQQLIAGLRALIRQHALGMNHSRNGISEFCFFIADAVAAHHRASGLDHLRQAAGQNALQNFEIAFVGKTDKGQRSQRLSTHGIDVAERVGGGDLAEGIGIVHDGREKIHRLHQRRLGREQIHAGVVGVIEADQHIRVLLPG